MIPKIIHYCWFGGNPLPELAVRCIESWKKFCPDYEIKEWNENNYDISKNQYTYQAYKAKKWGFVPDYIRNDLIYTYGGFYFDTDVEIIKPLDSLLEYNGIMGFESKKVVNGGNIVAGVKGLEVFKELRDIYDGMSFYNSDGTLNLTPSPKFNTEILIKHGLNPNNTLQTVSNVTVFPTEYFCPKDLKTMQLNITENSYTIHHYDGSWCPAEVKRLLERKKWIAEHVKNKFLASFLKKCCTALKMIGM